jgi:hypothetical protein
MGTAQVTVDDFENTTNQWNTVSCGNEIVDNPHQTGLNVSCKCLQITRETSCENWSGAIYTLPQAITGYNYVHALMYRNNAHNPNLKITASGSNLDMTPMNTIIANQWQDVVFDISDKAQADFLMFMADRAVCGYIQTWQTANNPGKHDRLVPMLLWLNVPMLKKGGAKMYDPKRCFALQAGGRDNPANWYDTGAALLEDVRTHRNGLNGTCLSRQIYTSMFIHYQQGSWQRTDRKEHMAWLQRNAKLWAPATDYPLGPVEGTSKQLKIYVCTHKDFVCRVKHPAYEVMDARDFDGDVAPNGLGGLFYSEVLSYWRLSQQKTLPKWIGFCGWRKYWEWMSNVPDVQEPIVCRLHDVGTSVREHYAKFANPKDLELATVIIDEQFKDFSPAWHQQLDSHTLHPFNMFIIPSKDFRKMMKLVWAVLD